MVRILELLPATDFGSTVCCRLHHVRLEDAPAYSAISYCWGKSVNRGSVHIGHSYISVTDNLEDALRHLRQSNQNTILWVDAICIDQSNIDERHRQIRLMQRIYQSSRMTLIWLGNGHGLTDGCLNTASQILNLERVTKISSRNHQNISTLEDTQKQYKPLPFDDPAFLDFTHLKFCEWFERVWVVQEIAVASAALVCLGNESVQWPLFYSAMAIADLQAGLLIRSNSRLWPMQYARERLYHQRKWRLLDLLMAYRNLQATDPRDKVYALLGLLACFSHGLQPDYTRAVVDVYRDTALMVMRADQNLDILAVSRVQVTDSCIDLKLPSWVPDWRSSGDRPAMKIRSGQRDHLDTFGDQGYRFRASGSSVFNSLFDHGHWYLGIDGFSLGRIWSLSKDWNVYGGFSDTRFHVMDFLSLGPEKANQIDQWMTVAGLCLITNCSLPESDFVPFWETMVMSESKVVEGTLECDHTRKPSLRAQHKQFLRLRWATRSRNWRLLVKAAYYCLSFEARISSFSKLVALMIGTFLGISKGATEFEKLVNTTCFGRCMMQTDKDNIGLVPATSEIGDHVFLVKGSTVPIVLRPQGDKWELVGEAYVHCQMYGESWEESKCSRIWLI